CRGALCVSDIKAQASAFRQQQGFSAEAGGRKENIKKNRYKDILPYDQTRVVLNLCTDEGQTDYINASFIQGVNNKRCYIATQGPLPHTVLDFWRMIWEYEVKVGVTLLGKKCERYWPLKQELLQIGPFSIVQEERPLTHFQYVAWPDRGIPDNYSHFLEMIEHMRLKQGDDSAPICVHCSAGCGRTGVICILEHVRHLLLQQSIPPNFSIFDIVLAMRKQRPSAVQTLEQYEFLFHAVAEMFRSALATAKYETLKEVRGPRACLSPVVLPPPSSPPPRSISVPSEPTPDLPPKMSDTYAVVNKFRRGGGLAAASSQETRPCGGRAAAPSPPQATVSVGQGCGGRGTGRGQPPGLGGGGGSAGRPLALIGDTGESPGGGDAGILGPSSSLHLGSLDRGWGEGKGPPSSLLFLPPPGYNFRIGKPKGPRDPPAEWTRL
uniref:protein-tyrosine-phosphatase n=1 Tax=Gopherus evgoodei TaxID=1825980 RepID=A0A8C4WTM8_9SAUR